MTQVIRRTVGDQGPGAGGHQGLSGPAKAELSLAHGAAAVMPPFDWARLLTPEAEELALGAADTLVLGDGDGCAEAEEDTWGFRLVKSEPRMSSTVPGLRLASSRSVT